MGRETVTIGIDIGTSGAKGILLAASGAVLARATAAYPLLTPRPGWTEQEPEAWWQATLVVLRSLAATCSGHEVAGIGLSGQMHGSVFLDAAGDPIRPALLWNDARTHAECDEIDRRLGRERIIAITGNRASTGFQAPKLLWLRANEPEAAARLAKLLLPKDFIRLRLTGEHATDAADASGTLFLDLRGRRYSDDMLAALEVPATMLPQVYEGPEVTGRLTDVAAALTGLPAGVPVVAGGGDNACAAIGAGLIEEGHGVCSLGTSGTLFVHSMTPRIDPEGALNAFCDAVPGGYHLMGVILAAGGSLGWYRDKVVAAEADLLAANGLDPFAVLLDQAAMVPAGAEGLLFLPYLAGERSPHMDPHARGAWIGLSLAHDRRHMVRALDRGRGVRLCRLPGAHARPRHRAAERDAHRRRCPRRAVAHHPRSAATGAIGDGDGRRRPRPGRRDPGPGGQRRGAGPRPCGRRRGRCTHRSVTAACGIGDDLPRGSGALPRALSGAEGRRLLRLVPGGPRACIWRWWRGGSLPVRLDRQIFLQRHVTPALGAPEHTVDAIEGALIALLGLVEALFRLDAAQGQPIILGGHRDQSASPPARPTCAGKPVQVGLLAANSRGRRTQPSRSTP